MSHTEGVVKFRMRFAPSAPIAISDYRELNAWRRILYQTALIGQDPARYEGYGFGNISQRVAPFDALPALRRFVITGTQTGGWPELGGEHYAVVTECHPELNLVVAEGAIEPSAESLTHGTIYALDDAARFVLHAHSPHIWRHARRLGIPETSASVAYGTPEMADEVRRLFLDTQVREQLIFSMAGHADGIITFGSTAEQAGTRLLAFLARAYQME